MELLIIVLFVNMVLFLFRKKLGLQYSDRLNCGIFGFSLKPSASRRVALQKFKILGIYNKSRGRDATGVFVNGEIIKEVGLKSEFDDFIEDITLPAPKENGIMLGHTRQGSVGYKKTIEEAHPFLIDDNFVFTHNGTIKNVKALCEKYNLTEADFTVDSQVLGTMLYQNGPESLENYTGYAALAFTRLDEPNTLWLYHGKSKEFTHAQPMEERPLFIMETKDGIFYSSLEEALLAIRDNDNEVPQNLKYNNVFKISNGKWLFDEIVPIDREEANITYIAPTVYPKHGKTPTTLTTHIGTSMTKRFNSTGVSIKDPCLIKRETLPSKLYAKEDRPFIYYHWGRYWEAPRKLLRGPILLKKGGYISNFADDTSKLYFFWDGIMLKSKADYEVLLRLDKETMMQNFVRCPNMHNFAMCMSRYSEWPVCNIQMEGFNIESSFRNQWYENNSTCDKANFTPKFANGRNFKILNGYLIAITASQRERVLFDTAEMSNIEAKALSDGTLIRTPGGSSKITTPFLLPPAKTTTEGEVDLTKDPADCFFFDVIFETRKKGMESLGIPEMLALRTWAKIISKRDYNLVPDIRDIDQYLDEMYDEATQYNRSLLSMIPNKADQDLLVETYDKVLNSLMDEAQAVDDEDFDDTIVALEKSVMQSSLPFTTIKARILEEEDFIEINEDDMTNEEIDEEVENGIIELENLQVTAMNLMDAEDSDYAQEAANVLITSTLTSLAALEPILHKYDKFDFLQRVKKIREAKIMKDGVL